MGLCPELNKTFPVMLPGWATEKLGDSYVMISPRFDLGKGVSRPDQLWNSTPGSRGGRVQLTSFRDVAMTWPGVNRRYVRGDYGLVR